MDVPQEKRHKKFLNSLKDLQLCDDEVIYGLNSFLPRLNDSLGGEWRRVRRAQPPEAKIRSHLWKLRLMLTVN